MLQTIHHLWPPGAHFVYKCYHQWSSLVLWNGNGTTSFLHSREGMTQGDPLDMVAYGIGILLLIKYLKSAFTDVTQPWYAGDASALGTTTRVGSYFNSLKKLELGRGYHPELSKSVLIVHPENFETVNSLAHVMGLMCAWACVILAVISGMMIPNMIG